MTKLSVKFIAGLLVLLTSNLPAQDVRKPGENEKGVSAKSSQDAGAKAESGSQANKRIEQAADATVRLLAKDVAIHGKNVRYEPQPHKNTVGYWTDAKDWVSWDFKINQPGTFKVELTQACGKGSGGSEYIVEIDDQALRDIVPDTGSFTNFINRTIGQVKLAKPGNYTVSVKPIKKPGQAVMDLRAITLTPVTETR